MCRQCCVMLHGFMPWRRHSGSSNSRTRRRMPFFSLAKLVSNARHRTINPVMYFASCPGCELGSDTSTEKQSLQPSQQLLCTHQLTSRACAGTRATRATSSMTASLTMATCVIARAQTMVQRLQPCLPRRLPRRSLQPGPSSPLQETFPGSSASFSIACTVPNPSCIKVHRDRVAATQTRSLTKLHFAMLTSTRS